MHNDYLSGQDEVSLFKATVVTHMELSDVGDYVSYRSEEEEVCFILETEYNYCVNVIKHADGIWIDVGLCKTCQKSYQLLRPTKI